ncbi:transcriptional regulator [Pseudonocardia sp. NPDC049635]|uniref:transcriptional regulator n=1 Tax=Pseudonocardia sp. NPDC049635 TaxID=3155506 RepID=UPI0033DAE46D
MATERADPAGAGARGGFDDTIHAPVRLRISGILRHVEQIDFAVLRDTLGITDATLSKHLRVLVDAGYATTTKSRSATRSDARRLTGIAQTRSGRAAFDAHVAELRRIAAGAITDPAPPPDPAP